MKDTIITVRLDKKQLQRLQIQLGLDQSKTIRACLNCTENVILSFFGGEVKHIFKRNKDNETLPLYNF